MTVQSESMNAERPWQKSISIHCRATSYEHNRMGRDQLDPRLIFILNRVGEGHESMSLDLMSASIEPFTTLPNEFSILRQKWVRDTRLIPSTSTCDVWRNTWRVVEETERQQELDVVQGRTTVLNPLANRSGDGVPSGVDRPPPALKRIDCRSRRYRYVCLDPAAFAGLTRSLSSSSSIDMVTKVLCAAETERRTFVSMSMEDDDDTERVRPVSAVGSRQTHRFLRDLQSMHFSDVEGWRRCPCLVLPSLPLFGERGCGLRADQGCTQSSGR